ncbi:MULTISPECIES: DUF1707 domain-containing protein [unclassified Nocardioides]|uniref:DUF1707 SHOCT-like domain-containing protein n=1 Tax=unclassified Nocardioides TaxID=2615069 RepID=UPI0006F9E585|nr:MULTISPECIES: DUF1707 domain-containing protein [unclassified Nocardioides]KQY56387.1 hypothetical protein ASD30_08555 [Nocardioides sp. Root140]KQZ75172.1 hypothetical protein ASD66_02020 [Nocardioides sp. Root151]KRF14250.1 hypothetical protein ASH02_07815 [Nocardioides sp. Soil796]
MEGTPGPHEMRISDADRHKVAEVLRDAAAEGRLDFDELDERLDATYAAKVYADLVPITADLPMKGVEPVRPQEPVRQAASFPANVRAPVHRSSLAIMGGQDRRGVWQVNGTHTAFAMMGGIDIDLRQAILTEHETTIIANTVMGGIDVIVNAFTVVVVEGFGIMGDFSQGRDRVEAQLGPDSPIVRVKGFALMGGVTVVRKPMPGEGRRWRGHGALPGH